MDHEIIAITGHRDYVDRAALYRGLDDLSAKHYYLGGAQGVDNDALEHLARTQPNSLRTVVVPNRLIDQPIKAIPRIRQYATEIIELKNTGPDRYMIRNRYMVDNSHRTVAFYDNRVSGGTLNTMKYSESIGHRVTLNNLLDYDLNSLTFDNKFQFVDWVKGVKRQNIPLSNVKSFMLRMILKLFHGSIQAFASAMGISGARNLEAIWKR